MSVLSWKNKALDNEDWKGWCAESAESLMLARTVIAWCRFCELLQADTKTVNHSACKIHFCCRRTGNQAKEESHLKPQLVRVDIKLGNSGVIYCHNHAHCNILCLSLLFGCGRNHVEVMWQRGMGKVTANLININALRFVVGMQSIPQPVGWRHYRI